MAYDGNIGHCHAEQELPLPGGRIQTVDDY
jgi:hypothetical protein